MNTPMKKNTTPITIITAPPILPEPKRPVDPDVGRVLRVVEDVHRIALAATAGGGALGRRGLDGAAVGEVEADDRVAARILTAMVPADLGHHALGAQRALLKARVSTHRLDPADDQHRADDGEHPRNEVDEFDPGCLAGVGPRASKGAGPDAHEEACPQAGAPSPALRAEFSPARAPAAPARPDRPRPRRPRPVLRISRLPRLGGRSRRLRSGRRAALAAGRRALPGPGRRSCARARS